MCWHLLQACLCCAGALTGHVLAHAAGLSLLCESPLSGADEAWREGCCVLQLEPPSCACFGMPLYAFSEDSLVRSMAAMYGFSAQCTSVGTSYFARLAARDAVSCAAN